MSYQSDEFYMNGDLWRIFIVDQNNHELVDRTNNLTLATTDPVNKIIFLSSSLYGDTLMEVFIHELGHCMMISYGLIDKIHEVVKQEYWIYAEEWLCNYLIDYGLIIFSTAFSILGYEAWKVIVVEIDNIIKGGM